MARHEAKVDAIEIARSVIERDAGGFVGPLTHAEAEALDVLVLRAVTFEQRFGVQVELGKYLRARLMLL